MISNQETFPALLGTLWFYSSVCSHVLGQVARKGKFFPHTWQQC